MKLFLVTCGQYSDYTVVAIFDGKALAEAYIKTYQGVGYGEDFNEMEEMTLNPVGFNDMGKLFVFNITLDYENGNLLHKSRKSPNSNGIRNLGYFYENHNKKLFNIEILCKDETTAIKAANEKRLMHKANNP